MSLNEVTARTRAIPIAEAIAELELALHEAEDAYGRTPKDSDVRRAAARRLVALDMGRSALGSMMDDERRRRR